MELGYFGITFALRTVIKGQSIVDFMVELTYPQLPEKGIDQPWHMYVDDSSTNSRARAGIVLISIFWQMLLIAIRFSFLTTNNEVEYEALVGGLHIAMALGVHKHMIYSNS